MKEFLEFFKDIFMINDLSSKQKVGLSQFKTISKPSEPVKKQIKQEVKLSDLMRRSA